MGREVPGDEVVGFKITGLPNPKIELDNGKYVFGCECWWASEEEIKRILAECKEVIEIDIDEYRKEVKEFEDRRRTGESDSGPENTNVAM